MKNVFIVITFLPNKHMRHHPAKVFTKLENVEHFHGKRSFSNVREGINQIHAAAIPTKPDWKVRCVLDNEISCDRTGQIINQRIHPFHQSV